MIDEELYQQAADELNSEHRRPHIWARACALANDDHDEARFLYTNLRVQELLAERETGQSAPFAAAESDESDEDELDGPALEPLGTELPGREPSPAAASDPSSALDDASRREDGADLTRSRDGDATLDLEPDDLPDVGATPHDETGEHDATSPFDLALAPPERERADTTGAADERGELLGSSDTRALGLSDERHEPEDLAEPSVSDERYEPDPAEPSGSDERHRSDELDWTDAPDVFADSTPAHDASETRGSDDLDWLDEAYRDERQTLAAPKPVEPDAVEDADEELLREPRRQADDVPDGGSDTVIVQEPIDTSSVRRTTRVAATDAPFSVADRGVAHGVGRGYEDAPEPLAARAASDGEPLELDDEDGAATEYAVFAPDGHGRLQAVRQGGSWWALMLTLPWLLYRRLIGIAIVYALFSTVVTAGLFVTALAWLDAGSAATLVTQGATVGFAVLALVGLVIVPFRSANHWREDKLERRGFELVAYVRAQSAERAIALARRATGATR